MGYLIIFVILTIVSQILLKKVSLRNAEQKTKTYFLQMIKDPMVILAYGLSFVNVIIWIMALSTVPLLTAFLFTSVVYVLMVFIDHWFFNERINMMKLMGAGLISGGIILSLI